MSMSGSEDTSSSEGVEIPESLVSGKVRRSTAGNRINKLLEEEHDVKDDFYKNLYGGFDDESDDEEYKSEDSDEDDVDSDFDIDETKETEELNEEEEYKPKKKRKSDVYIDRKKTVSAGPKKGPKPKQSVPKELLIAGRSARVTTKIKSELTIKLENDRSSVVKVKRLHPIARRLTQADLLEEAKLTERINTQCLADWIKNQEDKLTQAKLLKKKKHGPMIRYLSTTMPAVVVQKEVFPGVKVEEKHEKCSRTFITFPDERTMHKWFPPHRSGRSSRKPMCPLTRQPAKYYDPITKSFYSNLAAFKILRKMYREQKAAKKKL